MNNIIRIIIVLFFFCFIVIGLSNAALVDELRGKIDSHAEEIKKLETEINEYQNELTMIEAQGDSLEKEVQTIDVTRKKLAADIRLTENKISSTDLNIEKLQLEIVDKEYWIEKNLDLLSGIIRKIDEVEGNTLVELILSSEKLSDFWDDINNLEQFQDDIRVSINDLRSLKQDLQVSKTDVESEREKLISLNSKLSDQKEIADSNRYKKNQLLAETKNKESNYKKILTEKEELKEEFERELLDFESQLKIAIDPNSLPSVGSGVLYWPLASIYITQKFGQTEFAKTGAYNGTGHNGVDFRASVGTEVYAAATGVVEDVGNTDQYSGCYSYGKWVLVRHYNGLSTLYAHLSLIKVSQGQDVNIGDVIGYSGNTGYSTGPHLHFTVYATQGVEVIRLGDVKKITNCADARIPVAPFNAYLNPLDYL